MAPPPPQQKKKETKRNSSQQSTSGLGIQIQYAYTMAEVLCGAKAL